METSDNPIGAHLAYLYDKLGQLSEVSADI